MVGRKCTMRLIVAPVNAVSKVYAIVERRAQMVPLIRRLANRNYGVGRRESVVVYRACTDQAEAIKALTFSRSARMSA